ncbi:MAG: hypothetical protein IKL14_05385 [Alphaproteobacteria bacterium]|nr:hypothetical protein [Alphaproteobacteria bacterium]
MKVKNIMFSGFMAVILSGVACSADAAGFQVASKQYVDAREDAIETAYKAADEAVVAAQAQVDAGQNTEIAKKADKATTLAGYGITDAYTKAEVDETFETIANVNAKVKALADTVGGTGPDGSTGIVSTVTQQGNRITDLETKVGDKTVANQISEALGTYTTEKGIEGLSGKVTALEGTVGNSTDGLVKEVADLQTALTETGSTGALIKANTDAIAAINSETNGILKQANEYTDAEVKELSDGAVATNTAAITKLDGDVTVEGSVKKQIQVASEATKTAYEAYALPKPTAECANTTCVLAIDENGKPYWTQLWMYGADGDSATETNP